MPGSALVVVAAGCYPDLVFDELVDATPTLVSLTLRNWRKLCRPRTVPPFCIYRSGDRLRGFGSTD